jgi:hypothetical protein
LVFGAAGITSVWLRSHVLVLLCSCAWCQYPSFTSNFDVSLTEEDFQHLPQKKERRFSVFLGWSWYLTEPTLIMVFN